MEWLRQFLKNSPTWTAEDVVALYRGMGFFRGSGWADSSASLFRRFEEDQGRQYDATDPWNDVCLLSYDEKRVWVGDPECDVCAENKVYKEVLREWAAVSEGALEASDIEEDWQGEKGPISIHFTMHNRRRVLHPKWENDWLDLNLLTSLNQLIAVTGREFVCASDVNFAIVFVLDAEKKLRLVRERRFPFATLRQRMTKGDITEDDERGHHFVVPGTVVPGTVYITMGKSNELRMLSLEFSHRGSPYGDASWTQQTAEQLGLQSTLRHRGRPRKAST